MNRFYPALIAAVLTALAVLSGARAEEPGAPAASGAPALGLESFLSQVRESHQGYQASTAAAEGARLRSREGTLLLAPTLFGSAQLYDDAKRNPFFTYEKLVTHTYSLGVSQQFSFGTQARLSYNLGSTEYKGFRPEYHEGRPLLEVTQPLWRNWLGGETRANQEQLEAGALASHHQQRFQGQAILADAEAAYWRLAAARENIAAQREALEAARRLVQWNERRARLNLAESSDLLQAQAAFELRRLQLEAAENDARSAALALNSARGREGDSVPERLELPAPEAMTDAPALGARPGDRADVLAAEQAERAAAAAARMGLERNRPSVDLFGTAALNSFEDQTGRAITRSFRGDRPTYAVGVRFTAPLDLATVRADREGYRLERQAAEDRLQRKRFEQDSEWRDLSQQLSEARTRLRLARSIEQLQDRKVRNERKRLGQGRSTTYQVLVFEQDFSQAILARIQAQATVLQLQARLKLYNRSEK